MTLFTTIEDDRNYFQRKTRAKSICKHCGHTIYNMGKDRVICNWCNHWVYKNDKIEFKYKIKEELRK